MPGDNVVTTFKQAIEALGGVSAAAARLGYAPSRVCQWRDRHGTIPPELFLLASEELKKEGVRPTWGVFGFRREKHIGYELYAKQHARWQAALRERPKAPAKKKKPPKPKKKKTRNGRR